MSRKDDELNNEEHEEKTDASPDNENLKRQASAEQSTSRTTNDVDPYGNRRDDRLHGQSEMSTHMKSDVPPGAGDHGGLDYKNLPKSTPGWKVIMQELIADKLALFSLIIFVSITAYVFGLTTFLDQAEIVFVDLFAINQPPGEEFRLGTDYGGRDIFGQLIIGTRNSLAIGFLVTLMSVGFGIIYGMLSGYFGGQVDNALMRVVDFFLVLPFLMIVIVFVTIVPSYDIWSFSAIMAAFLWMGTARLIRSLALQEKELDYINASKTMGSSSVKIIFSQMMPNLVGIIIVNGTLSLAANIGIESGLSFLGFGFPEDYPSLGTLLAYATQTQTLQNRWWIWLPAALMILVLMLCVRNIGEALRRAGDARQRQA